MSKINIKLIVNGNCSVVTEQYILGNKESLPENNSTSFILYDPNKRGDPVTEQIVINPGVTIKFTAKNNPINTQFIGWFVFSAKYLYGFDENNSHQDGFLEIKKYDSQNNIDIQATSDAQNTWLLNNAEFLKSTNSVYLHTIASLDTSLGQNDVEEIIILARCIDAYINKSHLGDIKDSIGREYTISVSNIPGKDLLTNSSLRENNIIVSSPIIEDEFNDVGTYSLFMTDSDGNAVRLSYTIMPGNGLHVEQSNGNIDDYLRMAIDSIDESEDGLGSICSENDILYVNKKQIIDEYTLTVNTSNSNKNRGEIAVVTANLDKATPISYGIAKGDEFTTYINPDIPGQIIVNTQNLETVDDKLNRDGIVKHSSEMNRTIAADNGRLQVLTYNLDKASATTFGVVKTDDGDDETEPTILAENGIISVNTHALDKATSTEYGIVKADEITTFIDSQNPGQIKVRTSNLDKATIDDYGVVRVDGASMLSYNGILSVNRFSEIEALLKTNNPEHEVFREDIEDLKNRVAKLETSAAAEEIEMFVHVGETTTILPKPVCKPEYKPGTTKIEKYTIEEYSDKKTIPFLIKTNCKFNVKVEYEFNENPQINLIYVQLGDGQQIPGSNLGNHIFESTGNSTSTLNLTFAIKNYSKDENVAFVNTQAIVTVASINDSAIKQSSFHIFKRWNNNAFLQEVPPEPNQIEGKLDENAFMVVYPSTAVVSNAGSSSNKELAYNGLSTGNQYFNITSYAYYYTIGDDGSIKNTPDSGFEYTIQLDYNSISDASNIICDANWLNCSFSSNYSNTQKFNVISSASKKVNGYGLVESNRSTNIVYKFNPELLNISGLSTEDKFKQNIFDTINGIFTDPLEHNEICTRYLIIKNSLDNIKTLNYNIYFTKGTNKVSFPKTQKNISSIITDKISKLNTLVNNNNLFNDDTYQNASVKSKENIYTNETKALKLIKSIMNEYNLFIDMLLYISNKQTTEEQRTVSFEYVETLKTVQPRVTVISEISKNTTGIKFTVSRTKESILASNTWGVNIKYNFVDNKGHLVNTNGSTDNIIDYNYDLKSSTSGESFTYTSNNTEISSAQSGIYNSSDSIERFNDTMSINIEIVGEAGGDWLAFGGKNDYLKIRTQRYSWETGKETSGKNASIPIDLYAIMKNNNGNIKSYNLRNGVWYNDGYYRVDIDEYGWGKYGLLYLSFSKNGPSIYSNDNEKLRGVKNSVYYKYAYKVNTTPIDAKSYKISKGFESIPVQKSNNIAGIKIKEVSILNGSFVFQNLTESYTIDNPGNTITVISNGSWSTSASNTNTNYTFGNAYISNINVSDWDDIEMTIKITVKPGTSTNIPNGASITNIPASSGGKTNFVLLCDSLSYEYKQIYNNMICSATPWNSTTGCIVSYKLYNRYSLQKSLEFNESTLLYNSSSNTLISVYVDAPIKYAETNPTRNKTYKNNPLLTKITGIKLWISLGCQSVTLSKNFQASSGSLTDKILLPNATYKNGSSKSLDIKNVLDASDSVLLIK